MRFLRPPWGRLREKRNRFLASRSDLHVGDVEFVASILPNPTEDERRIASLLRRILAEQCGVPADKIRACDRSVELDSLIGNPGLFDRGPRCFDWVGLCFSLTVELRKSLSAKAELELQWFCYTRDGQVDESKMFGSWVVDATRTILTDLTPRRLFTESSEGESGMVTTPDTRRE
jgi:hypothetical protein